MKRIQAQKQTNDTYIYLDKISRPFIRRWKNSDTGHARLHRLLHPEVGMGVTVIEISPKFLFWEITKDSAAEKKNEDRAE